MSQLPAPRHDLEDVELIDAVAPQGWFRGTSYSIRSLWAHRELLGLLIRRELKSKYKDSSLGFLWSMLRPLTQLIIYYVAIGKFLGAERSIPDFAIYIFAGLTVWTLLADLLGGATTSIVANAGLIKKVYLPREIFPLSALGSAGFNFIVQFLLLLVATIVFGVFPLSPSLFYLPLAILAVVLFGLSVGIVLSAVNVYLRDVQHLIEVALLVMFWASPIVYSFELVHGVIGGTWLEEFYLANPVTLAVMGFQRAMWSAGADEVWPPYLGLRLGVVIVISLILLWAAQRVFAKLEGNFAQEL